MHFEIEKWHNYRGFNSRYFFKKGSEIPGWNESDFGVGTKEKLRHNFACKKIIFAKKELSHLSKKVEKAVFSGGVYKKPGITPDPLQKLHPFSLQNDNISPNYKFHYTPIKSIFPSDYNFWKFILIIYFAL